MIPEAQFLKWVRLEGYCLFFFTKRVRYIILHQVADNVNNLLIG